MGWSGYNCDTDIRSCGTLPVSNCANWVHYQIAGFESYTVNHKDILTGLLSNIQTLGAKMFDDLWWKIPPPKPPSFDVGSILMSVLGVGLPFASHETQLTSPDAFATVLATGYSAIAGMNPPGVMCPVVPNEQASWVSYVAVLAANIDSIKSSIDTYRLSQTGSSSLLTGVTEGGNWSTDAVEFLPTIESLWPQIAPYYSSRIAMQAMKTQGVFLMSVTLDSQKCTQHIADSYSAYFGPGANVAWCSSDTQVVIPIVGWSLGLYDKFPTVLEHALTSNNSVFNSSSTCYHGFGQSTFTISLYKDPLDSVFNTSDSLANLDSLGTAKDMKRPCAWSVPICDFHTWLPLSEKQKGFPGSKSFTPTENDFLPNIASVCAYHFGMVDQARFCGNYQGGGPYAPPPTHICQAWYPPKIVQLT